MIDELRPDEIESVLHRHHVGHLACIVDGEPYVVPITYTYQDGFIYGRAIPGQKLDAMRAEPRVAFQVEERWEADTWRSAVVRGVFEELTAEDERGAALGALQRAYPDTARVAGGGVLFRIRPSEKTGRSVQRPDPVHHMRDVEQPLQGIDLRQGDEKNFPDGR
jgi:pyridoxamine 5'-phosphate oxidase-like protein